MPKYGLLTNPGKDVTSEINEFARLGFDYTEIGIEEPFGTPQILRKNKKRILAALKKNKMFTIGHTVYWVDFGSSHSNVRRGWVEEAKEMIRIAKEFDMEFLNFHFYPGKGMGARSEKGRKMFLDNFLSSMRELAAFAKKNGVTLMLENMARREDNPYRLKEFTYIVNNVPGLMVHLDVAHAFTEGGNKKVDEYIQKFAGKIVHIHIHDNHGKKDEHLPLGKGKLNVKKVVSSLKKINYKRTITFEVFSSDIDAQKSMKLFKKIWDQN
jgi:sugar phosphate isomerase/epimerase